MSNAKTAMGAEMTKLIDNSKLSNHNCAWCDAKKGKAVHAPGCPMGERYKQVQSLGGVPFNPVGWSW